MVSLWPWKGDNTSPESFEKALSALSAKITSSTTKLEARRQSGRRYKALWTLYTSIAYLLYLMVVVLVVGWQNWGASEYTALSGAPVAIYLGRLLLDTFYNYRINGLQTQVNAQQKEREITISKLKAATKYDSTQQLLEKYGGTPSKTKAKSQEKGKPQPGQQKPQQQQGRTTFAPPPTANIPGRQVLPSQSSTPQRPGISDSQKLTSSRSEAATPADARPHSPRESHAEFAPNAFPAQQYAQDGGNKWYDRLLDVLLGEDESNPKNRLALICKNCRLVNGQAPPGVKSLDTVGEWRCSACGTMNGEHSEAKRLIEEARSAAVPGSPSSPDPDFDEAKFEDENASSSDVTQYSSNEDEGDTIVVATGKNDATGEELQASTPLKRGRGRPKGSTKKKT